MPVSSIDGNFDEGFALNHHHDGKIDKAGVRRILIRATNWVGDAIMTLPALEAVRENFPGRYMAVLAKPWGGTSV